MSDQDGNPFYGVGLDQDAGFFYCTANGDRQQVNFGDFSGCSQLIDFRCDELIPNKACPCFDEEDLMAVTAENVAEGACKEIISGEIDRFVMFNENDSARFELERSNVALEYQCSGRDDNSGLDTDVTFSDNLAQEKCDRLINEHCAAIGQPVEPV